MIFKTMTAALLATTLAGTAFAQSTNANDNAGANVTAGSNGADVSAQAGDTMGNADGNASVDGMANYGQLIASMKSGSTDPATWETEIGSLSEDATVDIVTLTELQGEGAENAMALDNAMADSGDALDSARTAIGDNEDLASALEGEDFTAEDVIAVYVSGDDAVTLVVDDRA